MGLRPGPNNSTITNDRYADKASRLKMPRIGKYGRKLNFVSAGTTVWNADKVIFLSNFDNARLHSLGLSILLLSFCKLMSGKTLIYRQSKLDKKTLSGSKMTIRKRP